VVLASDSRTNAGIPRLHLPQDVHFRPGDRFFALLTAGNLSLTQGVISLVSEWRNSENPEKDLYAVNSMFGAARVIGTAIREVHKIDGGYLQQHDVDFSVSFHPRRAAQRRPAQAVPDLRRRQFHRGDGGHQLFPDRRGEIRQAHSRPHHPAQYELKRRSEMRADLLRLNHALQRLGRPAHRSSDLPAQFAGKDFIVRLEDDDPYLQAIRDGWGGAIHKAFHDIGHDPGWAF
jgi:putative proteasome-type protease